MGGHDIDDFCGKLDDEGLWLPGWYVCGLRFAIFESRFFDGSQFSNQYPSIAHRSSHLPGKGDAE
jgi:hypothetical protein